MNKTIERGRNAVIFLFSSILLITIANIILDNYVSQSNSSVLETISYFFIPTLLMYLVYSGKDWAKATLSAFLVFGTIVCFIGLFLVDGDLISMLQISSIMMVYGYVTYALNNKKEIENFMKYQRSKAKKN